MQYIVWKPPDPGYMKINSDVAVRDTGSIIALPRRDNSNSLCMAYMKRMNAMDTLYGEAVAVKTAMEQATRLGWNRAQFECDSLSLCHEVNSSLSTPLWNIVEIVDAIRDQLRRNTRWQISWIPRKQTGWPTC